MFLRLVSVAVPVVMLLSACATERLHSIYQGPSQNAVSLQANDTVIVTWLDGEEQSPAFIGQKHEFVIAPGKHVAIIEYRDIFDVGADNHEKVQSNPIKVTFEGRAGAHYRFDHAPYKTLESARKFAEAPVIVIVDAASGAPVNASFEKSVPASFISKLKFEGEEAKVFVSDQIVRDQGSAALPALKEDSGSSGLQTLQKAWAGASDSERKHFLKSVSDCK